MNKFLPLFPLKLVVYPGEDLNLHIFEPRYRQLIKECEEEGLTFGIPAFIDDQVMEVGTEIELVGVEKRYPGGESDIKTRGVGIFEIQHFHELAPGKLYAGADVKHLEISTKGDPAISKEILTLLRELFKVMKLNKEIPQDPAQFSTFTHAHHVGFSLEQEYEFLCILDEFKRQEYMRDHLLQVLPTVREMENLRQRIKMNGHFKNIIPPKL